MGEALYDEVVGGDKLGVPCRIYAPVGAHAGPRRLSRAAPAGERRQYLLRQSPGRRGGADRGDRAAIPWRPSRREGTRQRPSAAAAAAGDLCARAANSRGMALDQPSRARGTSARHRGRAAAVTFAAAPIVGGKEVHGGQRQPSWCCARTTGASAIGTVHTADAATIETAIARARAAAHGLGPAGRAGARARSWTARPTSTSATACG